MPDNSYVLVDPEGRKVRIELPEGKDASSLTEDDVKRAFVMAHGVVPSPKGTVGTPPLLRKPSGDPVSAGSRYLDSYAGAGNDGVTRADNGGTRFDASQYATSILGRALTEDERLSVTTLIQQASPQTAQEAKRLVSQRLQEDIKNPGARQTYNQYATQTGAARPGDVRAFERNDPLNPPTQSRPTPRYYGGFGSVPMTPRERVATDSMVLGAPGEADILSKALAVPQVGLFLRGVLSRLDPRLTPEQKVKAGMDAYREYVKQTGGDDPLGAFGRSAGESLAPGIGSATGARSGSIAGGVAGSRLLPTPAGKLIGGTVGMLAGAFGGGAAISAAQEKMLRSSIGEKAYQELLKLRQTDADQFRTAQVLGQLVPSVILGKPVPGLQLRERAGEAGVEVLGGVAEALIQGKPVDVLGTATQAFAGAAFPGESRIGKGFGAIGGIPTNAAINRYESMPKVANKRADQALKAQAKNTVIFPNKRAGTSTPLPQGATVTSPGIKFRVPAKVTYYAQRGDDVKDPDTLAGRKAVFSEYGIKNYVGGNKLVPGVSMALTKDLADASVNQGYAPGSKFKVTIKTPDGKTHTEIRVWDDKAGYGSGLKNRVDLFYGDMPGSDPYPEGRVIAMEPVRESAPQASKPQPVSPVTRAGKPETTPEAPNVDTLYEQYKAHKESGAEGNFFEINGVDDTTRQAIRDRWNADDLASMDRTDQAASDTRRRIMAGLKDATDAEIADTLSHYEASAQRSKAKGEFLNGEHLFLPEAADHQDNLAAIEKLKAEQARRGTTEETPKPKAEDIPAAPVSKPANLPDGADGVTYTASNKPVPFKWVVKSMDDVIASHDEMLSPNPKYVADGLQPRPRTNDSASKIQVQEKAARLNPQLLGESAMAAHGAPIIGPDNLVEGGNGRMLFIRKAYNDSAFKEQGGSYKQFVEEFAKSRGIDITGIDKPVLVRQRVGTLSPEERQSLARDLNRSGLLDTDNQEKAADDADRVVKSGAMAGYQVGKGVNENNRNFIEAFFKGLNPDEIPGVAGRKSARITPEGNARIKNAVLHAAYGDDPFFIERVLTDGLHGMKKAAVAIQETAADMAALRAREAKTKTGLDITGDVARAVRELANIKQSVSRGQTVKDALADWNAKQSTHDMFGEAGNKGDRVNPATKKLIDLLSSKSYENSTDKVQELLSNYAMLWEEAQSSGSGVTKNRRRRLSDWMKAPSKDKLLAEADARVHGTTTGKLDLTESMSGRSVPVKEQTVPKATKPKPAVPRAGKSDTAESMSIPTAIPAVPRKTAKRETTTTPKPVYDYDSYKPVTEPKEINSTKWFHGSSKDIPYDQADPWMGDASKLLMGNGFYVTTDPDIAGGYARTRSKKGGEPTVNEYSVKVDKVIDADAPAPKDIRDYFQESVDTRKANDGVAYTYYEELEKALAKKDATFKDLLDAMREDDSMESAHEQISMSEYVDNYAEMTSELKRLGYDAIVHKGGVRTGKQPHTAMILLDPNDWNSETGRKNLLPASDKNTLRTNQEKPTPPAVEVPRAGKSDTAESMSIPTAIPAVPRKTTTRETITTPKTETRNLSSKGELGKRASEIYAENRNPEMDAIDKLMGRDRRSAWEDFSLTDWTKKAAAAERNIQKQREKAGLLADEVDPEAIRNKYLKYSDLSPEQSAQRLAEGFLTEDKNLLALRKEVAGYGPGILKRVEDNYKGGMLDYHYKVAMGNLRAAGDSAPKIVHLAEQPVGERVFFSKTFTPKENSLMDWLRSNGYVKAETGYYDEGKWIPSKPGDGGKDLKQVSYVKTKEVPFDFSEPAAVVGRDLLIGKDLTPVSGKEAFQAPPQPVRAPEQIVQSGVKAAVESIPESADAGTIEAMMKAKVAERKARVEEQKRLQAEAEKKGDC